jgi:transcriptional regulator with XRE-family HTH domain
MVRARRRRARLTQEHLAERAGLSPRTIRALERGEVRRPRPDSVALLVDALGLTGGPREEFEAAAWEGDRPGPPGLPAAPCQLPTDLADFTGRAEQVALVQEVLADARPAGTPTAVVVSAVAGKAGVGKTALAVHVAHRLRPRFPDGQLYVDLRGAEPQPLDPAEVLSRFLRALGVDGAAIPADIEERTALYRARLADRRVLVVLDDAVDEAQVRRLLPGTAGCGVLATSRARLSSLEGARLVDLDVLTPGQAVELLGRIAGAARVAAEPEAAAAIVGYCGRLPLAVRIAGAKLVGRPHWSLDRLAALLADERGRLDQLAAGDLEVRASVALSYQALTGEQQRTFRLLGLLEAPDFARGWPPRCSTPRSNAPRSWSTGWCRRNCWRSSAATRPGGNATGSTTCCACTPANGPPPRIHPSSGTPAWRGPWAAGSPSPSRPTGGSQASCTA